MCTTSIGGATTRNCAIINLFQSIASRQNTKMRILRKLMLLVSATVVIATSSSTESSSTPAQPKLPPRATSFQNVGSPSVRSLQPSRHLVETPGTSETSLSSAPSRQTSRVTTSGSVALLPRSLPRQRPSSSQITSPAPVPSTTTLSDSSRIRTERNVSNSSTSSSSTSSSSSRHSRAVTFARSTFLDETYRQSNRTIPSNPLTRSRTYSTPLLPSSRSSDGSSKSTITRSDRTPFKMPDINFPLDPVQTFPRDVQKSQHDHVIIHYLESAVFALRDGTLVRWGFDKPINDGSIQFSFLPPLQGKKHLRMVMTNNTTTTFKALVSFTATSTPMPREVENIPGSVLNPIEIPNCRPSRKATIIPIHKKKHLFKALSSGRYLYFVVHLQAKGVNSEFSKLMPRLPNMIPTTEVLRRRSLSARSTELGTLPDEIWTSGTNNSSSSSTVSSMSPPTTDSPGLQRRRSTIVPFDHLYTNIKQILFKDIPPLTHIGSWGAPAFETRDASEHYWEFSFAIQEGSIEVSVFNQGTGSDSYHSTIAVAFYVSDKYIPNEKSLQNAIQVCRQQQNVHSFDAPVLEMCTLKHLRDSAVNIHRTPFVYFAYGIHPYTPKPTFNDLTGLLELQIVGTMNLRIRLKVLAYLMEKEECNKLVRSIRSLSLSDPKRLAIKDFRAKARGTWQSPAPSPLPSSSSSDDEDNETEEGGTEDSGNKSDDQEEADAQEEEAEDPVSLSSRAYQTWNDDGSNDLHKGTTSEWV